MKINFDIKIILIDGNYFKHKIKNLIIKTMITSVSMQKLKTIIHVIDKYAMLFIYFSEIDNSDRKITVVIIEEIYLINELKTKFLINNYILYSKKITFLTLQNQHTLKIATSLYLSSSKREFDNLNQYTQLK